MLTQPPLALYVHLPWCERKCPYCDFNSYQREQEPPFAAYAERLLQDLAHDLALAGERRIESVFFGGGTPSLFPAEYIAAILTGLRNRAPVAADAEITLEANPGSAEAGRFRAYRDAGVNRLSIGVQSFNDASLLELGRVHDGRQARSAIAAARAAGFANFNLDLMHGLPAQEEGMAHEDLREALAHEAPHLSWYQLTIEPNTAFHAAPPRLPVEDVLAGIQERGEHWLAGHGYAHYEVSAFAQPGHSCRHNQNYWRFGDYIGIGAGAHGKLTFPASNRILRTRKTRSPRDYLAGPVAGLRIDRDVDSDERALEFLMNALRLRGGVSLSEFEQRTGLDAGDIAAPLMQLRDEGLMEPDRERLCTTSSGYRFLDSVLARFA